MSTVFVRWGAKGFALLPPTDLTGAPRGRFLGFEERSRVIAKDIQKLSDMLRTATDFSEVQSAFFDLSESSDLLSHGGPWRSEAVEKAVGACVASMVPGTTAMDLFLVRIPEFGFAHGSLVVEGRMGTVIYFEKTQMGLVTLGTPGSNECNLARFTASRPMQGASLN